jgi:hypothetical protein
VRYKHSGRPEIDSIARMIVLDFRGSGTQSIPFVTEMYCIHSYIHENIDLCADESPAFLQLKPYLANSVLYMGSPAANVIPE